MTEKASEPVQETEKLPNDKRKDAKSEARKSKRHRGQDVPTKVVIRCLPPTMTETEFLNQIAPVPKYDNFYFAPPDWSLGQMASSRAYITFHNPEDIYIFRDKFDGYVFVDAKGNEYPAVVEYAPFQGLSKSRSKKKDVKCNTIESDPHYIAFLEALKAAQTEPKSDGKLEYSYQLKEDTEITSTPLLEYLANKKKEKQAEKKRKADEKKRKRDEDRQSRRKQIARNIPDPIKEEASTSVASKDVKGTTSKDDPKKKQEKSEKPVNNVQVDEDGIMVRVVPSRLDRNQRKSKDVKEETNTRRESARKERNAKRLEQFRNRDRNEKKFDKDDKSSSSNQKPKEDSKSIAKSETPSSSNNNKNNQKDVKDKGRETKDSTTKSDKQAPTKKSEPVKHEVKKYSERRKEIRARAENRRNEAENIEGLNTESNNKNSSDLNLEKKLDASAQEFVPKKSSSESWVVMEDEDRNEERKREMESESSANEKLEKKGLSREEQRKRKQERAERRIRNKDRPAMEIYQPRRVRIAANFTGDREENLQTPDSESKMESSEKTSNREEKPKDERSNRERKPSKSDKPDKKERKHSKSDKEDRTHRKRKSKSGEDESREMSRQNSQGSELGETKRDSSDDSDKQPKPVKNQEDLQEKSVGQSTSETVSTDAVTKAVESLAISEENKNSEEIKEDKAVSENCESIE